MRTHYVGQAIRSTIGRVAFLLTVLLAASLAACRESPVDTLTTTPLSQLLTADLAAELTPEGIFPLQVPHSGSPSIISADRAGELALAFVETFGTAFQHAWSRRAGRSIPVTGLSVAPRVFFATSAYEPLPNDVHAGIRKVVGPFYLVTLTRSGEPVLSIAVSAYNTDMEVRKGRLDLPTEYGNDFFVEPITPDFPELPLAPEDAVRIAADTGSRIRAVPVLIGPKRGFSPQHARWKIELESEVQVRLMSDATKIVQTRELFVGPTGSLEVARESQLRSIHVRHPISGEHAVNNVEVRTNHATRFDGVTLVGGAR